MMGYLTDYLSLIVQEIQRNLAYDKTKLNKLMDLTSFINENDGGDKYPGGPELYQSVDERVITALVLIKVLAKFSLM